MIIDLRALRYCQALAQHGSFSKAAKELRIAQPALSVAIRKLEEELGLNLFVRHAKQIVPSPEARILLKSASKVFEELDLARRALQAAAELRVGEVKVGFPPMFGKQFLPSVITRFHQAYPDVVITAMEGSADEIRAMLDSGAIDLGLLENRRVPPNWEQVEVGRDETVLCVAEGHPLASRTGVTGNDLDGLPMVVFDSSFIQRSVLDQLCKRAGVAFRLVLQSNFVPIIHEAVAAGMGAATLLRSSVADDPRIVLVSFEPPEVFQFSLCCRSAQDLSKANRAFLEFAAKDHVGSAPAAS